MDDSRLFRLPTYVLDLSRTEAGWLELMALCVALAESLGQRYRHSQSSDRLRGPLIAF